MNKMEYQKIIFLGNEITQPFKFRIKTWFEINDDACRTCNTNIQIKFKTTTLKFSFYDYSDFHILRERTLSM